MMVWEELGDFQKNVRIPKFEKAVDYVGKPSGWDSHRSRLKSRLGCFLTAAVGKPSHDSVPSALHL